jgi:choline-sulfatase
MKPCMGLVAWLIVLCGAVQGAEPARPNVLFLAIDDLNDWVGPLGGHAQAQTPHLDRLAARGTTFLNAHCQSPLCNPSRTSVLLGLRPTTTGIYALEPAHHAVPELAERVSLLEHFKQNGYQVYSVGKLWHAGMPPAQRDRQFTELGTPGKMVLPPRPFTETPAKHPLMDWGPYPERDDQHYDYQTADWAIRKLSAKPNSPFFLAVGFSLPHVPCYAPQKWFDLYPNDDSLLPAVGENDRDDIPFFAWYLHWQLPEPRLKWLQQSQQWRPLVRSYLASISFMDDQVGRVLAALEASGQAENTVVVLWGDHGWHLGEKGISGKNTLWERSTRVPLLFAGPGIASQAHCERPVELLDLYPTLVELAGLPTRNGLEGESLVPLLQDASAPRGRPAITSHGPGNHAVRSARWRYIHYADGSEELYDHHRDPREETNLLAAEAGAHAEVLRGLRAALPAASAPPAAGSKSRLIELKNGTVYWETEPVAPQAPIPE